MTEYIDRTQIEWYGCDFEGGIICCKYKGNCSKCTHGNCDHDEVMNIPPADVVKREKIDKIIKDIKNIDLIVHDGINHYYKSGEEVKAEVLVILKRNIEE